MKRLRPNSIKEVPAPILSDPVGIDMVVVALQTEFANEITWLEKSFGRAVRMVEQRQVGEDAGDLGEYVFPALIVQEGYDFFNLMEVDNFDAYSFFYAHDPEEVVEYEEGIQNTYRRRLSCVFWMNLQRVDESRKDDFLEELKREITKVISNARLDDSGFTNGEIQGIEILEVYDEPDNIFEGFTVELQDSLMLHYPFRGLRIELDCTYVEDCIEE